MKKYRIWFRGEEERDIEGWRKEAAMTRQARMDQAFRRDMEHGTWEQPNFFFEKLWFGQDLDLVNARLTAYLEKERDCHRPSQCWGVIDAHLPVMCLYFCFGQKGNIAPGRLYPGTEKALLAYLWAMTEESNDIHIARESVWYVNDSENLDLGHKVGCLLTAMIFSREEAYKDRVYPNLGRGFRLKEDPFGPVRERTITEAYRPLEQYMAWVEFFHRYFTERARKGFFIERASCGYMKWTLGSILGLYTYVEDGELKEKARKFLDLVWADWAQEEINGIRGGVKTRHHYTAGETGTDAMEVMARWFLGGPGEAGLSYKFMMLSGYELPPLLWEMILDREDMGRFTYLSRGITEENPVLPRPAGCDCTMLADVESRCVRISYVTPDYILSSQMEHPRTIYNHLAVSGRWMGLVTGTDVTARIVPVALDPSTRLSPNGEHYHLDLVCNCVQSENVLIFQQKRRWTQANPAMFPAYDDVYDQHMGIFLGTGWEEIIARGEVLFLRKGKVYASVRVICCLQDEDPLAWAKGTARYAEDIVLDKEPWTWEKDGLLRLKSPFSPVILEAGSEAESGNFGAFVEAVADNPPRLWATVVKREAGVIIQYRGTGKGARQLVYHGANNDVIPTIDGRQVEYRYPMIFDSPYMRSAYDSGVVTLQFHGKELVYDFTC